MVETLINLKNNKLKKNITQNQGGDAVERMKKFLSGLGKKRHGLHIFRETWILRL
jgi:nucleolar MIF4G domain-containing protein 1